MGPLVLTYHADVVWVSDITSRAYRSVHKLLHTSTPRVIVHTADYRARCGDYGRRIEVVPPPGTDFESPRDIVTRKDSRFRVLFVGQLRPYKGVSLMLSVASQLPNVDFVVCGVGRLERELKMRFLKLPNVQFLGQLSLSELLREYSRAHVVCLPSVSTMEAYGVALLEGATFGAVPVASDLPGVRENVALLGGSAFRVGDRSDLYTKLRALAASPAEWWAQATECRQRALRYSETHTVAWHAEEHERIYLDAIASTRASVT